MDLADRGDLSAVTMRAVASALGVEAMSLYNHIANRADLLDAMVDRIFARIELPDTGDWRADLQLMARGTRTALRQHPWATGLLDSRRSPGEVTLQHHDHVLRVLGEAGFSPAMSIHVLALVDSYVYGSVIQESSLPFDDSQGQDDASRKLLEDLPAGRFPHLAEVARTRAELGRDAPGPEEEFEFGLQVIMSALHPGMDERQPGIRTAG